MVTSNVIRGGKGANQAVAAARAGGVPTTFIGALGQDTSGDLLSESLRAAGVDISLIDRVGAATGTALIAVAPSGENTIIVAPGANQHVQIGESQAERLAATRVVLAQLEIPLDIVHQASEARTAGTLFVLNAAPSRQLSETLWNAIDVLVVNEHEAADLVGRSTSSSPAALAAALLERVPAVVITLGGEGSLVATREGDWVTVPVFEVEVKDTTGAGDTYCGVLAAELAKGHDLAAAARVAAAAGALATTVPGAQQAVPTVDDIDRLTRGG